MHAEHADNSELNELSGRVIGCAFTVLNTLGAGFLEKVYENALTYEVRAADLSAVQQYGAKVHYKDILVGEYFVDLLGLKTVEPLVRRAHVPGRLSRGSNAMHQISGSDRSAPLPIKPRLEIERAWPMAYEPRRLICVFCVHRLSASALKFFLDLQRRKAGDTSEDCTRSQRVRSRRSPLNLSESL